MTLKSTKGPQVNDYLVYTCTTVSFTFALNPAGDADSQRSTPTMSLSFNRFPWWHSPPRSFSSQSFTGRAFGVSVPITKQIMTLMKCCSPLSTCVSWLAGILSPNLLICVQNRGSALTIYDESAHSFPVKTFYLKPYCIHLSPSKVSCNRLTFLLGKKIPKMINYTANQHIFISKKRPLFFLKFPFFSSGSSSTQNFCQEASYHIISCFNTSLASPWLSVFLLPQPPPLRDFSIQHPMKSEEPIWMGVTYFHR